MLPWEEARNNVLLGVTEMPAEVVSVKDARGRYLAEDVIAQEAMPPFDNSAMDGFAVRTQDLESAAEDQPHPLTVIDTLGAGRAANVSLKPNTAVRVMTGAPIPPGADAVVQVEWTNAWNAEIKRAKAVDGNQVLFFRPPKMGQNIRRAGESVSLGSVALRQGHYLRAVELSLLISIGCESVSVFGKPRVAVLSTGNELVEAGALEPGQIRDSNRPGLLARLTELGFTPVDCGMAGDTPAQLEEKVLYGAAQSDFLITSGGVSVGDFDFTRDVLDKLGTVSAYQVRVKPGKPQVFGRINDTPVFGLPGNPVSSLVVFEVFVLPALWKMAGRQDPLPSFFEADVAVDFRRKAGRPEFIRVHLEVKNGRWTATPAVRQGSGVLSSMTSANGFALLDEDMNEVPAGSAISCMWMA